MAAQATHQIPTVPLPENNELEADLDSSYGGSGGKSQALQPQTGSLTAKTSCRDTMSVASAIAHGYVEYGWRYHVLREEPGQYCVPADDKQFQSIAVVTVYGVDLYPPSETQVPPNCILQVDDITKGFTLNRKTGAFSFDDSDKLYARIYENLMPGGWIEEPVSGARVRCDDGSAPEDSVIMQSHDLMALLAAESGNPSANFEEIKTRIEKDGFTNVQEKVVQISIGDWLKHKIYKDAGQCNKIQLLAGVESWTMANIWSWK